MPSVTPETKDFAGKVALITGGGSGLGRSCARLLAERGARVVVADVDDEGGAATVADCEAAGSDATYVRTDVTRDDEVAAAVATAVDSFGSLHVAINNAGINGPTKFVADYTPEEWNAVIAVNLNGIFHGIRHEVPQMVKQGSGAKVKTGRPRICERFG
jgi:NAD(P)-dependent dehydrogenase (short-subunit alcohol dehydrogenase family)